MICGCIGVSRAIRFLVAVVAVVVVVVVVVGLTEYGEVEVEVEQVLSATLTTSTPYHRTAVGRCMASMRVDNEMHDEMMLRRGNTLRIIIIIIVLMIQQSQPTYDYRTN
jgi:hypothetical protein